MSPAPDDIPILERPSFFNGQRLTAADLTEVQQFHQELRWLHNRSLHSWGIAFGYQVLGNRGDRKVQISAGYAIDCEGRDLILTTPMEMPIPAVVGDSSGQPIVYNLTASYATDDRIPAETQTGTCGSSGAVRRPERPLIRWQTDNDPINQPRKGKDVTLATIKVQNCQITEAVSTKERRDAVPAQQPYISAGQTDPKQTTWRLYPDKTNPLGIVTTVSTASAGFRITPRYQAHVVGDRLFQGDITVGTAPNLSTQKRTFAVDGYVQIAAMTASKFDLMMFLPSGATVGNIGSSLVQNDDINKILESSGARFILTDFARINRLTYGEIIRGLSQIAQRRLTVGERYQIFVSSGLILNIIIEQSDFNTALTNIAQRNQITVDAFLYANGFKRETLSLQLNESLRIPGDSLPLNPADVVLKEAFLPILKDKLNWSVVWMGVEG